MVLAKCKYRPYCLVILLSVLGVLAYLTSLMVSSSMASLMRGFGVFLLGAALIDGLLTIHFQINIENQVNSLETSIKTLENTFSIASGAVESGLTAVYSERKECLEEINKKLNNILNDLRKSKNTSLKVKIKMLGISLGDFLCPHGFLQPTFRELLTIKNVSFEIVVLKDGSKSAYRRALREEEGKFSEKDRNDFVKNTSTSRKTLIDSYKVTKCHDELKTATNYLHDLIKRKMIDSYRSFESKKVEAELRIYEYDYDPMIFLFMVDDELFVENYHLAGRGGEAPIIKVAKFKHRSTSETSKLYEIYYGHFEAIKKIAQQIQSVNNYANKGTKDIPD